MARSRVGELVFLLAVLAPLAGCSKQSPPADSQAEFINPESEFPLLRYPDGQVSLNDRCPVRKVKLNPRMKPVYVNGRPVGFC